MQIDSDNRTDDASAEIGALMLPVRDDTRCPEDRSGFLFDVQGETCRLSPINGPQSREESFRFMRSIYAEKGWGKAHRSGMHYCLYELLPDSVTLTVRKGDNLVATMTIVVDSALGLPDDENFPGELNRLRSDGGRLAEIISLGIHPEVRGHGQILVTLFNFGYFVARAIKGATDFVITVLPHHTGFYCRKMLFEKVGPSRHQKKTGVTVDLLRLDFGVAESETHRLHAPIENRTRDSGTIYGHFQSVAEAPPLVAWLREMTGTIDADDLCRFLADKPELLDHATEAQREYIRRYVAYQTDLKAGCRPSSRATGPAVRPDSAAGARAAAADSLFDLERWKNPAAAW